jgi:hypothetical protein
MPAAAQLAPWPASPRSKMSTVQPAAASRQPIAKPMAPAPTMATVGREAETADDWLRMAGSLRWHDPDRFRGYDLSRQIQPAPQPYA